MEKWTLFAETKPAIGEFVNVILDDYSLPRVAKLTQHEGHYQWDFPHLDAPEYCQPCDTWKSVNMPNKSEWKELEKRMKALNP